MGAFRKAVNAMCRECIYDSGSEGTWRQQVEACTAPKCPLFSLRPRPVPQREDRPYSQTGPILGAETMNARPGCPDSQKPSTRRERTAEGPSIGTGEAIGGEP
jgi:hypothetical protein